METNNINCTVEQAFLNSITILTHHRKQCVVGVSAGVDSMTLLALFKKFEFQPICVHINYHLRGQESDEDERLVRTYCLTHAIPFHVFHFDKQCDVKRGESLQMAARRFRYEKFDWVKRHSDASHIALAHHMDDWIETFFLHLTRGSGLRGLVQPDDDPTYLRPLQSIRKEDIRQYAERHHIPWREDSSNSSDIYERNCIRNQVLPQLYAIHPRVSAGLRYSLENLKDAFQFIHHRALDYLSNHRLQVYSGYKISLSELLPWNEVNRALLHEILKIQKLPIHHPNDFIQSFHTFESKIWHVGYPLIFTRRAELFVYPDEHRSKKILIQKQWTNLEHACELEGWGRVEVAEEDAEVWMTEDIKTRQIHFRAFQSDDYIKLKGGGRKKVSSVLKDKKLNIVQRNKTLVMTVDGQVAWIVGIQADARYLTAPGKGIGLRADSGWLG